MKPTKYIYLHVVQGFYGYCGWEDVAASEVRREALANLREYRENEMGFAHRIIQRRELRAEEPTQ